MTPWLSVPGAGLVRGDMREVLALLPESSVDAIVTDPPYELGFMGKSWDASGVAFDPATWRACLRVLKPGGHLIAFAGSRTYHRIACAVEDGGFEIRDSILWLYGTGFPKSTNVSKEIDRMLGAERAPGRQRHRAAAGRAEQGSGGYAFGETFEVTAPASPEAVRFDGWGTALKPGHEPAVLARKPLIGTIAANFLEHGVGGLNIGACRIGDEAMPEVTAGQSQIGTFERNFENGCGVTPARSGRWPANVIFDEDAAADLDAQSGTTKSGAMRAGTPRGTNAILGKSGGSSATEADILASQGGASRFFYVAKPTGKERDLGLGAFAARTGGELTHREDSSAGLSSPRAGAGRTGGRKNIHPTVKPVELMRYLVRLVTPPGGLVLDPFTGSGSTGMAAAWEGMQFFGVDLDTGDDGAPLGYCDIARARILHALGNPAPVLKGKR